MKLLPALLCAAIIALFTPACATKKQDTASCCASKGSCDANMKKH